MTVHQCHQWVQKDVKPGNVGDCLHHVPQRIKQCRSMVSALLTSNQR